MLVGVVLICVCKSTKYYSLIKHGKAPNVLDVLEHILFFVLFFQCEYLSGHSALVKMESDNIFFQCQVCMI